MCTRLLYTVLPAPYPQASLFDLLRAWVVDLNEMSENGITATSLNTNFKLYLFKINGRPDHMS